MILLWHGVGQCHCSAENLLSAGRKMSDWKGNDTETVWATMDVYTNNYPYKRYNWLPNDWKCIRAGLYKCFAYLVNKPQYLIMVQSNQCGSWFMFKYWKYLALNNGTLHEPIQRGQFAIRYGQIPVAQWLQPCSSWYGYTPRTLTLTSVYKAHSKH